MKLPFAMLNCNESVDLQICCRLFEKTTIFVSSLCTSTGYTFIRIVPAKIDNLQPTHRLCNNEMYHIARDWIGLQNIHGLSQNHAQEWNVTVLLPHPIH